MAFMYFVSGVTVGLLVAYLFPSSSTSSGPSRELRHGSDATNQLGGGCARGCQEDKGWKAVNVFYGDSNHIVENSMISHEYYNRVKWYSQARQDEVVAALLRNKRNGYFIDLAANDPIKISNTYALETHFGWTGLCMEPNNAYWAGLAYRKCDVVGAVVGQDAMKEVWFKFPNRAGPKGGIVGNNFDNKERSKFDEDRPRYTVTLLEIFQKFQTPKVIDYMSLDVEGAEFFIMKGFPFKQYRFNLISLERPQEELNELLTQNGYKLWKLAKKNSGETLWYHESMEGQLDTDAAGKIDTMVKYGEVPKGSK
eukprot:CAMPEP_0202448900 /NCGR_PEP_ID=MMETSP1360-20130828/7691_1 /ASSEMBLY_ACC=CAM_ASM_000848 /TAXON_ID=515479 /ORGANISM="Licmophora paradoxa, Strain CCMP2313" /LENGTH=309 /DNA_ID=CAMNT_0049066661 /DNA_START=15 /DNA_END=941 /DNA_ORIENTATION=+